MADLTPEERSQRARRAREVLDGAAWLFDEVIAEAHRTWLVASGGAPEREVIHARAKAALDLKAYLINIVAQQLGDEAINERREQRSSGT